jgi:hypothetical protein
MAKRTIRRRARKNRTIRKVMRGCNRRRSKAGGTPPPGKMEVHQVAGASTASNQNLINGTTAFVAAQQNAGNTPPPIPPSRQINIAPAPANGMQGGARTRHHRRRLRYKKSVARKSRHA